MKGKHAWTTILAILICLALLAGCTTTPPATSPSGDAPGAASPAPAETDADTDIPVKADPITFSLLMTGWTTWDEPMDADPVGRWITEHTGVTIEPELITGEAEERFALVLATKEYPDFMQWPGDSLATQFINQGVFVAYDEHFDALPNVISRYGDDIGAVFDLASQHMYRISQWSIGNKLEMQNGMNIRHDVMKAYFGDRASTRGFITLAELEEFFLDYKQNNPKNADGATVYPLTFYNTSGFIHEFGQCYGIADYYETGADTIGYLPIHERMPELIKTLNRWYNNGILDPEFAINKDENMKTKMTTGVSIATLAHESQLGEVNKALQESDPDKYILSQYKVTNQQGQEAYYKYSPVGSGGLCLTTANKDIDRALSWVNFMNDAETMFILCNGAPGVLWDYDEEGMAVPKSDIIGGMADLWDRFRMSGGYKYVWMLSEGVDTRFPAYEGNFYEIIHGAANAEPKENRGRYTFWIEGEDNIINPALFQGIAPVSDSEEGIIQAELTDIWNYALPEMIMAKDEAAAIAIYDKTVQDLYNAGLQQFLDAVAPNYYLKKQIMEGK